MNQRDMRARVRALPGPLAWSWRMVHEDHTLARLATYINDQLGTSYTAQKVSDWLHGERPVPKRVQNIMRADVLQHCLGCVGLEIAPKLEP